jgi:hypothetical protein
VVIASMTLRSISALAAEEPCSRSASCGSCARSDAIAAARASGGRMAEALLRDGLIEGALLALADEWRSVGGIEALSRHGRA